MNNLKNSLPSFVRWNHKIALQRRLNFIKKIMKVRTIIIIVFSLFFLYMIIRMFTVTLERKRLDSFQKSCDIQSLGEGKFRIRKGCPLPNGFIVDDPNDWKITNGVPILDKKESIDVIDSKKVKILKVTE